jgi:choline dehydrogenase-like flavoprotein
MFAFRALVHRDSITTTTRVRKSHLSEWSMQVRELSVYPHHFVGSCGIGRVLDSDLRVIGFENLKVVDASAIPDMPENSGPAGTTYMLAEYAAERIIAEADGLYNVRKMR